jgi:hypothetical protein
MGRLGTGAKFAVDYTAGIRTRRMVFVGIKSLLSVMTYISILMRSLIDIICEFRHIVRLPHLSCPRLARNRIMHVEQPQLTIPNLNPEVPASQSTGRLEYSVELSLE